MLMGLGLSPMESVQDIELIAVRKIEEAQKLGFGRALIPRANLPRESVQDIELIAVRKIEDALRIFEM